ncbi:hypothetical protein AAF712_004198 [Marasmius tenuissimus]|uniref:DUF7729 domain-containing protein n=1 Tax=Marasmius tenuissimus TaxID=585030 RepID=A0ABR3A4H0_9AGAR
MLGHTKALISAIALGASFVPVYSFTLSTSCSTSLQGLLRDESAACFNGAALFTAIIGSQGNNTISVPNIVDAWLSSLCTTGSCTDENIAKVATNLTSGCSEDLNALGINVLSAQDKIVDIAQQVYPPVRQIACLKDDTANKFCAVQTISNVEKTIGGLTMDDISFLSLPFDAIRLVATGAKELACTNCMKSAFNIARNSFPSIVSEADDKLGEFCGTSFVDGSNPEGVSQSAKDGVFVASTNNNNNSATGRSFGNAAVVLSVVFSVFVLAA